MLPKHLRERKRYILCKIINANKEKINLSLYDLKKKLSKQIFFLYGSIGAANIYAHIIKYFTTKNEVHFIVMCNYKYVSHTEFALANISEINGKKIIVNILKVSGTQKKLRNCI